MKPATSMGLKATILTIGTEVCDGEILNTNAKWLASQLLEHGIQPIRHLTVPDETAMIIEALNLCQDSQVLVTTGGLGPTRDDFTSKVISIWSKRELVFDQKSWTRIQHELEKRGLTIYENHRQQCYFPKGAEVLSNSVGTADAYFLQHGQQSLYVLPGPPPEIAGIYEDHLKTRWTELARREGSVADTLKVWLCLGISESEMADRLEKIPGFSDYRVGFRPHVPYITFKLWGESPQAIATMEQEIDRVLHPWVVNKDDREPSELWVERLKRLKPEVLILSEEWTRGRLGARILNRINELDFDVMSVSSGERFSDAVKRFLLHDSAIRTWVGLRIHRVAARDQSWLVEFYGPKGKALFELDAPRPFSEKNRDRMQSFAIEKTLIATVDLLIKS